MLATINMVVILHQIPAYAKPINKLSINQHNKDKSNMYSLLNKTWVINSHLNKTLVKLDNVSKFSAWNRNNLMTGASVSWSSWFLHYTADCHLTKQNAPSAIWSVGFMLRLAITSLIYFSFTATIRISQGITEKTLNLWYSIACWMWSTRDG